MARLHLIVGIAGVALLAPTLGSADAVIPFAASLGLCAGHTVEDAPPVILPAGAVLPGYGTGGFPIRAANPKAQAFFDNGMQMGHAFAHKSAIAAFKAAEIADPTCAMCAWGEAWARGPTINYPIDAKTQAELAALADKAALLAKNGPAKEQRLIAAMQARYHDGGGQGPGDRAFAQQMDALARDNPQDNELAVLAADAWMIPAAHVGNKDHLRRSLELLAGALARNPDDTGAIHFYIHATEMYGFPGRAQAYADRLQRLAPAASHLVHMPSHTYYWVGRYQDAARANVEAVRIDEANAPRGGVWKLDYHGHNVSFGIGAAMIAGNGGQALGLAGPTIADADPKKASGSIGEAFAAEGRYANRVQVMALTDPGRDQPYLQALWRYARGEAAARAGDIAAVQAEAAAIAAAPTDKLAGHQGAVVKVAQLVLQGRAAMLDHKPAVAADAFRQAAGIQEAQFSDYRDPPLWWYPVRRSLAAALLQAGQAGAAQTEARAALRAWADDPLTLQVLARAERALGDSAGAVRDEAVSRHGWAGDPTTEALALI